MLINIKSLPLILVVFAFVVPLPLIFIINGPLWLYINFIFWFLLIFASGISAYSLFKRFTKDASIPYILVIGAIFVFLNDVSIRRGDEWVRYAWLIFSLVVAFVTMSFLISATLPMTKKYVDRNTFWKKHRKNTVFRCALILLSIVLVFNATLFIFPYTITSLIQWKAENNEIILNDITSELTQNQFSPYKKAYAIWEWFNPEKQNMVNTWRAPALHNRFDNTVYCSLQDRFPYMLICVRRYVDVSPLWVLTSRCGNCGEYATLYSEIAHSANLTVVAIKPFEMDHNWNEVLTDKINDTWIVVDPSRYKFNVDPHSYKNESENFSYVYAQYPGSLNEIDVTRNYTEVGYVNISTVDIYGNPISNVSIDLISHNRNGGNTGRNFKTNETGIAHVEIGVGTVSFKCLKKVNNEILFNATKNITLFENQYYDVPVVMELLPLTQNSSNILIYVIMFFIIVVGIIFGFIAIHKKKSKIEAWVFVRNACWLIGGGMTGFATVVFDIQLGTGGFAIFSLGFAIHAIVLSLKSEQRIRSLEIKEINRKLLMLKEENDANIQLINDLIQKKEHFYPEHLLNKKLKQSPPEKYKLTLDELKILSKAGVWIPKEKFSYDSALHVLEIAYQLDDNFIEKVREYIRVGKKLNVYKDFCQQWILTRNGIPNPDETYNYYNSLDDAKKTTVLMKNLLKKELKRFETSDIII